MGTDVAVALIAAISSLAVAIATAIVSAIRDRQRREHESTLRESQRAHDERLTRLQQAFDHAKAEKNAKNRMYLNGLMRSALSLRDVVNDILDLSKVEAGRMAPGTANVHQPGRRRTLLNPQGHELVATAGGDDQLGPGGCQLGPAGPLDAQQRWPGREVQQQLAALVL